MQTTTYHCPQSTSLLIMLGVLMTLMACSPTSTNRPQAVIELRDNLDYPLDDWRAYSQYDRQFTKEVIARIGYHSSDPDDTIILNDMPWVYTKAFAERFGMPKRWIGDDSFNGALAVAFRREFSRRKDCGWGRNYNNCSQFLTICYLDVYVDNQNTEIPWNTDQAYAEANGGGTSRNFLRPRHLKDGREVKDLVGITQTHKQKDNLTQQSYLDLVGYIGTADTGTSIHGPWIPSGVGLGPTGLAYPKRGNKRLQIAGYTPVRFQRNLYADIDLIVLKTPTCPEIRQVDTAAQIRFYYADGIEEGNERREAYFKQYEHLSKKEQEKRKKNFHPDFYADGKIYLDRPFTQRLKTYLDQQSGGSFFDYMKDELF